MSAPNSPGGADAVLPATVHASTSPRVAGGHPAGGTGPSNSVARPGSGESEVPTTGPPRPVRNQRSALHCTTCGKPIRKGQHVIVTTFARVGGSVDLNPVAEPWLTVAAHLREGCMASLTPEVIREARRARVQP